MAQGIRNFDEFKASSDGMHFAHRALIMMRLALSAFAATAFLVACGGSVAGTPSSEGTPSQGGDATKTSSSSSSGGTSPAGNDVSGPPTIIGAVYALEEISSGQTFERVDFNMQELPYLSAPNACEGAALVAGSCCYFAPTPPPPTLLPGDAGDGTTTTNPVAATNAGTITLTDVTPSNAQTSIGSFDFIAKSGGYLPANYGQVWQPGDSLRVNAAGTSELGAFSVSAPALIPPSVNIPLTISRTQNLTITWQPDVNAEAFAIVLNDGNRGIVSCSATDAAGTVTIDASMFADFASSARIEGVAERTAVRYTQTPKGRIAFRTAGWFVFDSSL